MTRDARIWLVAILGAVAVSLALVGFAGFLASHGRNRHTAVVYALRQGMQPTTLHVRIPPERRGEFARGVANLGALAEPDWENGSIPGDPIVYVLPADRTKVVKFAEDFAARP